MSQPQHSSGGRMPASVMAVLTSVEVFGQKLLRGATAAGLTSNSSSRKQKKDGDPKDQEEEGGEGDHFLHSLLDMVDTAQNTSSSSSDREKGVEVGQDHHRTTSTCLIPSVDHFASLLPEESNQVAIEVYRLLHQLYKELLSVYEGGGGVQATADSPGERSPTTRVRVPSSSSLKKKHTSVLPAPLPLFPFPPPPIPAPAPASPHVLQLPRAPSSAAQSYVSSRTLRFLIPSPQPQPVPGNLSQGSLPTVQSSESSRRSSTGEEHLSFVATCQQLRPNESIAEHGIDAAGFDTINNYAILQELGRGNFGKVMLACDLEGNQVAIKSMSCGVRAPKHRFARGPASPRPSRRPSVNSNVVSTSGDVVSSEGSLEGSQPYLSLASAQTPAETMVMREVAIMKKLRHKNIVQLREVIHDEEEDQTHLVMDYICNGALAEVSSTGVCTSNILTIGDLDACKDYIRQAAKGLEYLHRQGIVHRDVKPENLLVGSEKDCYIADFGVSAVLRDNKVVDVTAGTQSFFSPELLRGDYEEAAKYGEQSDVWALGVTLYAIVFGKLPFIAANIMALAHSVLHDPVPFPEGDSSHHPLQHVFEGVLHKDPSKRWTLVKFQHALRKRNSHGLASRLRSKVGDQQGAASLANEDEHEEKDQNGDGEGTTLMNYPLVGLGIGAAGLSCSSTDTPSSDHDGAEVVVTEEEVQQAIVTSRVSFFRPTAGTTVAAPRRFDSTNTFILASEDSSFVVPTSTCPTNERTVNENERFLTSEDGDYTCGGGI